MIPATDIVMPRFQLAILAAILFHGILSIAMPTIISAAEQEIPRRHSLIHQSAVESAAQPAKTQGTILQPLSVEPTRMTSPIEPPISLISPPTMPLMPLPYRRTLTKHPAIASITAPATPFQTTRAALTPYTAAGQVTQTTADADKGTTPTTMIPITKPMAAPLPGMTSTSAVVAAPTVPSPFTGAAGAHSAASAGNGNVPSSRSSRSASNLLNNSAIARLLQPPTPVATAPPSLPPHSTPPSSAPPSDRSTEDVTLTWRANGEPDLVGYKIYIDTASGTYSFPGSPFLTGIITSYTVSNLPKGQTYFFAMSAYDHAGNESVLSAEVSKSLY